MTMHSDSVCYFQASNNLLEYIIAYDTISHSLYDPETTSVLQGNHNGSSSVYPWVM